ncbi:unnamed protein product [Microthlaspi erraticum]|uniref:Retrotransposon gag domain-containing protein n=1 Tax=Microthlaspi erraticum TaxID=1685480 RepID=A0A6D2JR46_9BRAS|nr:unnamed protein product [Microthlaspi erraticum]
MSLAEKAHQWEKSLPHGTITTWDECKKVFLAKFFSTGRTSKLRSEISSFIQWNNETFADAWERFKGYISYGENYDSKDWSSTTHSFELEAHMRNDMHALHSKLDKPILAQFPAKQVHSISGTTLIQNQEGEEPQIERISPKNKRTIYGHTPYQAPASYKFAINGYKQQGLPPNSTSHQHSVPPGFPPMPYHTPPSLNGDMKEMLQQLLQGQPNGTLDMKNKLKGKAIALGDIDGNFTPHPKTTLDAESLDNFRRDYEVPDEIELALPADGENPEHVSPGFCCTYVSYFESGKIIFPIPRFLLEVLAPLKMAFPQMHPSLILHAIGCAVQAREEALTFGVQDLRKLFLVKSNTRFPGSFYSSPRPNRRICTNTSQRDSGWANEMFFFQVNKASIGDFDFGCLPTVWATSVVVDPVPNSPIE